MNSHENREKPSSTLRMSEVYVSVQGESSYAGVPCVFIRLTGCNLRCSWCDSAYTFTGGDRRSVQSVVDEVLSHGIDLVEITGGEPLLQASVYPLMQALLEAGKTVLLETSGSLSIAKVPDQVVVILDFKPPGSGEVKANLWENVAQLKPHHEVKFVLASREDYDWTREVIAEHQLEDRVTLLLSVVWGKLSFETLVQWMLEDKLKARLNVQLHKVIWDPSERGV